MPEDYDSIYLKQSRRGARVLALGYKKLNKSLTSQELRTIKREEIECELTFVGFVVISCPLKPDSKAVIKEIQNSSHSVRIYKHVLKFITIKKSYNLFLLNMYSYIFKF